ncbi:dethiobiotin synthase [Corynebacterium tapiri]|uniref:ATP-dependent dethiobiotin synthetase BioD n=1 Tax=Corynebacterium tapiri TaxID=1448266 RepID=A0A5C4U4S0_9CORY|nr:dethiobiotin synthase [Corynebacterium tapiri]TNL97655.1 ATP-dependent dethiobiotin synthetase BioD [Corynebacterium tapiri]
MFICITGTGTDVGKTWVTAALAAGLVQSGLEVGVIKPMQTGTNPGEGDAAEVARLSGVDTQELHVYPEPLAPNVSARRAGISQPSLAELCHSIKKQACPVTLIEGAGGLLVRLAEDYTLADVARELGAPLVVVTSLGLGSLNSAELTVEVARNRGLSVIGLVGGSLPETNDAATLTNLEELERVCSVPLLGCLPEALSPNAESLPVAVSRIAEMCQAVESE